MNAPVLEVRGLVVGYGKHEPVLHGIDLTMRRGDMLGLVGMNGAGKTTLMRALSGGLRPRSGEILVDGRRISGSHTAGSRPATLARHGIVLLPEGHRVLRPLTVEENLQIATMRLRRGAVRARLAEVRELVYDLFPILAERRGQLAGLLSGGEQQMLSLARAIIQRPRLLLLDEPSLGLAPLVVERIYASLESLQETGMSMLVVEQSSERLAAACRCLVVLRDGRVVAEGSPETLSGRELNLAYFG
jgi:branched-chain amino acid transport system ATP-binding protein